VSRCRALLGLVALIPLAACHRGPVPSSPAAGPAETSAPLLTGEGTPPRRAVTLLWPGRQADGLVPKDSQIFATREAADQARQVVSTLLAGAPDDTVVAPFPPGTKLTALFVDERGVAYVSLSHEARDAAPGGSDWEQLAVNALVGSLVRAVPRIHRVQLLIEGQEIESLTGHLDLRYPVAFDESLVTP
jgi:hypothetical protein